MSDVREKLKQAIFGQESGKGTAKTDKPNKHGVLGPMQILPATWADAKRLGVIPGDWDIANPEQNKQGGFRWVDHLLDTFGGDPAKAAAAYYSGKGAIKKDGTIHDWSDKLYPNAPTTLQYVAQVLNRAGLGNGAQAATSAAQAQVDSTPLMQRTMPGKAPASPAMARNPVLPADPLPQPVEGATAAFVAGQEADAVARADKVRDVKFGDRVQAAFLDTPEGAIGRLLIDRAVRDELPAEPGYKPDPSTWGTRSEDEIHELLDATSAADERRRLASQAERRQRTETVSSGGMGPGLLAGLVAGLPGGLLTGSLAYRGFHLARVGSAQLAMQGRTAAALGSAAAENVGLNLGLTAVQDAIEGYQGQTEYAMAMGFGLLGTGMAGFGIKADVAAFQADQMARTAADGVARLAERAAARLGPDATPEQIRAEMTRMERDDALAVPKAAEAPLGRDRRLVDVDDEGNLRTEQSTPATAEGKAAYRPLSEDARPQQAYAVVGARTFDPLADMQATRDHFLGIDQAERAVQLVDGQKIEALFMGDKPGVVVQGLSPAEEAAVRWLHEKYMPDAKLVVGVGNFGSKSDFGDASFVRGGAFVRVHSNRASTPEQRMQTLVHEMGHSIWKHNFQKVSVSTRAQALADYGEWLRKYHGKTADPAQDVLLARTSLGQLSDITGGTRAVRASVVSGRGMDEGSLFEYMSRLIIPAGAARTLPPDMKAGTYVGRLEEFTAEQFGKYIESQVDSGAVVPPSGLREYVIDLFKRMFDLFKRAKAEGLLKPTEGFKDFFDEVAALHAKANVRAQKADAGLSPFEAKVPRVEASMAAGDPVAERHGLNILPEATDAQRAEKRAIIEMYRKAENPEAAWNNIDPKFIDSLTDNRVFNVASTSLRMLKSKNPVVRMIAAELLESPTGAAGRQVTAAISKHILERKFMGNAVNDFQAAYKLWRNENGGNIAKDAMDGEHWDRFNRLVAEYVESRRDGSAVEGADPAVMRAASVMEAGYERMRLSQVSNKTLGWAGLPGTSIGYMPHRMSPGRVRAMSPREGEILHSALVDQFVQIEGWDISFSANLASKYIERVRSRALGEYDSTVNIHSTGAADTVEDALKAMGMTEDEVKAQMGRYMRGGPGYTKRRIRLDLNADQGDGFRLLDLFETDQLRLLRTQAQRVSGEVALARHGVMGKPGLKLLRRASGLGAAEVKATDSELEAFDQAAAELLGEPFGSNHGKWLDRAVQVNSLARLGGMGFTQMAEFINAIVHVGAARTLSSIGDIRRLRAEIKALARGESVENPIIGSLERYSGAEFGTDSYKLVFPFDNHDMQYQLYGRDTPNAFDRLLRGGAHAQAKLSLWRSIHSAQQRGMAEQIVKKALEMIQSGKGADTALADMGITADVVRVLQQDMAAAATFDGNSLRSFDITRIRDKAAAEAFVQAVHRGSAQIIQGTFVGETGKWAHDGLLRVITQFRTFSITSVEKQWGRQLANRGAYQALGILLGSMSLAAPIYMARTYLASVGREDQDEYLEKHLAPAQVARATLNYVAMSGLSGDMLDALTAVTGVGKVTGGRTGSGTEFIGNVIAPSAGLVDDVWRSLQNTKEGTDPTDFLKTLPFSNLPYMKPLINSLGD